MHQTPDRSARWNKTFPPAEHIKLALEHAVVPGLGRYAGKDLKRWDTEKGAFMSDHDAQSAFEKADEVPAAAVAEFFIFELLPVPTNAVA